MGKVTPYWQEESGEMIFDIGWTKVTLNTTSDTRLHRINEEIDSKLYVTDSKGNFITNDQGDKTFKPGISKRDVIIIVHDTVHKLVGEYDQQIKNSDPTYYYTRDGDKSAEFLGGYVGDTITKTMDLPYGKFVCADYAATEVYFLNKNGFPDATYMGGHAVLGKGHLNNDSSSHAWVSIEGGQFAIETTVEKSVDPIRFIDNVENYNKGWATIARDSNGGQSFYSSSSSSFSTAFDKKYHDYYSQALDKIEPLDADISKKLDVEMSTGKQLDRPIKSQEHDSQTTPRIMPPVNIEMQPDTDNELSYNAKAINDFIAKNKIREKLESQPSESLGNLKSPSVNDKSQNPDISLA